MSGLTSFTDHPGVGPYVVFPTHAHQILSNCIHVVGVSVLAYCFARRTENELLVSKASWVNMTWARLCIILVFLDSWVFLALSGILVNGVGLSYSVMVCSLGIYACIVFYCGSKALIYFFLVERTWIVWSAGDPKARRLKSRVYWFCLVTVLGYIVIFLLMLLGRISELREDGSCVIGVRHFASIPLLSYDLFVNIFLTMMFIIPLYQGSSISKKLRYLAWRTLLAAAVALTTSSINVIILVWLGGRQLGWVCLGSCSVDVTVNAIALYWVTAGSSRETGQTEISIPTLRVPTLFVQPTTTANRDDVENGLDQDLSMKETVGSMPGRPMACPCHYRVVVERAGIDVEVPVLTHLKPAHVTGHGHGHGQSFADSGVADFVTVLGDADKSKPTEEDWAMATASPSPAVAYDVETPSNPLPGPSSQRVNHSCQKKSRRIWRELRTALGFRRQAHEQERESEREVWEDEGYRKQEPLRDEHGRLIERYICGRTRIEVYDDRCCTCSDFPQTFSPLSHCTATGRRHAALLYSHPSHRPRSTIQIPARPLHPPLPPSPQESSASNPDARTVQRSSSLPLLRLNNDTQRRPSLPQHSSSSSYPLRTLPER